METKYTKDGKKVAIIGELNQNEYIVQEISVTESGDEIPAGDRFTAKGLLDEPVETWKTKRAKALEADIVKKEAQLKQLNSDLESVRSSAYKANAVIRAHAKLYESEDFENAMAHTFDIFSGKYTHKCRKGSYTSAPCDISYLFVEADNYWGKRRHGAIRSFSVWFKDGKPRLSLQDEEWELFESEYDAQQYILENLKDAISDSSKNLYGSIYKSVSELSFVPDSVLKELENRILLDAAPDIEEFLAKQRKDKEVAIARSLGIAKKIIKEAKDRRAS